MEKAIEIRNLTKNYGKNRGVTNLSIDVEQGDIYGFLGPNGAGKSTTIRSILGLIHFQGGNVRIFGKNPVNSHTEVLRNIGYIPSETMFYPSMRAGEVIRLAADVRKMDCTAEAARLCELLQVDTGKKIEELSLGNRKKVSIVCAMQHKPKLFIFDEPTSGLDPLMQDTFFKLILDYNKKYGTTCFYSSHVLSEVKNYCRNAAIIKEGKLIKADSVENLTNTNFRKVKIKGIRHLEGLEGMTNTISGDGEISFVYSGDINQLIFMVSTQNVTDILIEEPSLEEIFMHFYEKEEV